MPIVSALNPGAFYVAAALFAVTFLLGVLVQSGYVRTKEFRWVHHALFFGVAASAVLAALVGIVAGEAYGVALIPVIGIYLILPRVRAGTFGHGLLAVIALTFYLGGFVLTLT